MAEMLLINPRRKRRAGVRRMRRNPRRMSALQRQYFGGGRRNPRRRRRSRPAMTTMARNPRRRYRRARAAIRRFRRNPRGMGGNFNLSHIMRDMLVPAGIGAAGALALDLAWGNLPIPASLQTGTLAPVARIAGAVLIGIAVGMVAGKRNGAYATVGAMTVTLADLAKNWVASSYPAVSLGGYVSPRMGYYGAARQFTNQRVGNYVGR